MKNSNLKTVLVVAAIVMMTAVEAHAAGSTSVINKYVNTLASLVDAKIGAFAITLVMITSGIMAWKNATWGPLAWGAAASLLIAGASSIGTGLSGMNFQ